MWLFKKKIKGRSAIIDSSCYSKLQDNHKALFTPVDPCPISHRVAYGDGDGLSLLSIHLPSESPNTLSAFFDNDALSDISSSSSSDTDWSNDTTDFGGGDTGGGGAGGDF